MQIWSGRQCRVLLATALALGLLTSLTAPASSRTTEEESAAAGDLDTSFGRGGKIIVDFGTENDEIVAIIIQNDGKIVTAGDAAGTEGVRYDFALARFNPGGSPDISFGANGKLTTRFGGESRARAIGLQADGKIVAAGYTGSPIRTFAVARYNVNGSLDPSFGAGGLVTTSLFGQDCNANSVLIQQDGKIVVTGLAHRTDYDFALVRYLPDGALDQSFGAGGIVATDFSGCDDFARAAALQPDGRIVVAGASRSDCTKSTSLNFALARYQQDGSLDPTFGIAGKVVTDLITRSSAAVACVLQPDGKIVVAELGIARVITGIPVGRFAVARYNSDGSLDRGFGQAGVAVTDFNGQEASATGIAIQPDGKIVATGSAAAKGPTPRIDFALARYDFEGNLDSTFGIAGKVTTDMLGGLAAASCVALGQDGRIFVAGSANSDFSPVGYHSAMAGYFGVPDFSIGFDRPALNATRGTTVKVRVNITRIAGFTGKVTVTPPGVAADVGIIIRPDNPTTTNESTVRFKLKVKPWAPAGPQQLTFRSEDDTGRVRTAGLAVLVQ